MAGKVKLSTTYVDFSDMPDQQCILCGKVSTAEEWRTTWVCLPPCEDKHCTFKGKDVCYECGNNLGKHEGILHSKMCDVYGEYEEFLYNSDGL